MKMESFSQKWGARRSIELSSYPVSSMNLEMATRSSSDRRPLGTEFCGVGGGEGGGGGGGGGGGWGVGGR